MTSGSGINGSAGVGSDTGSSSRDGGTSTSMKPVTVPSIVGFVPVGPTVVTSSAASHASLAQQVSSPLNGGSSGVASPTAAGAAGRKVGYFVEGHWESPLDAFGVLEIDGDPAAPENYRTQRRLLVGLFAPPVALGTDYVANLCVGYDSPLNATREESPGMRTLSSNGHTKALPPVTIPETFDLFLSVQSSSGSNGGAERSPSRRPPSTVDVTLSVTLEVRKTSETEVKLNPNRTRKNGAGSSGGGGGSAGSSNSSGSGNNNHNTNNNGNRSTSGGTNSNGESRTPSAAMTQTSRQEALTVQRDGDVSVAAGGLFSSVMRQLTTKQAIARLRSTLLSTSDATDTGEDIALTVALRISMTLRFPPRDLMAMNGGQAAVQDALSSRIPKPVGTYIAGLCNHGATCYINVGIQVLFNISFFRREMFALNPFRSDATYYLQKIFYELATGTQSVSTIKLLRAVGIDQRVQNDAHEFLSEFFLHRVFHRARELFSFQVKYITTCDSVQFTSSSQEVLSELSTVVTKKFTSLEDAVAKEFSREPISDLYDTGNASLGKQKASRQMMLLSHPTILFIHSKRFDRSNQKVGVSQSVPLIMRVGGQRYHLHSIILHSGSGVNCGHYTALIRRISSTHDPAQRYPLRNPAAGTSPNIPPMQFFRFDDEEVTPVSDKMALMEATGLYRTDCNRCGYVFTYIIEEHLEEALTFIPPPQRVLRSLKMTKSSRMPDACSPTVTPLSTRTGDRNGLGTPGGTPNKEDASTTPSSANPAASKTACSGWLWDYGAQTVSIERVMSVGQAKAQTIAAQSNQQRLSAQSSNTVRVILWTTHGMRAVAQRLNNFTDTVDLQLAVKYLQQEGSIYEKLSRSRDPSMRQSYGQLKPLYGSDGGAAEVWFQSTATLAAVKQSFLSYLQSTKDVALGVDLLGPSPISDASLDSQNSRASATTSTTATTTTDSLALFLFNQRQNGTIRPSFPLVEAKPVFTDRSIFEDAMFFDIDALLFFWKAINDGACVDEALGNASSRGPNGTAAANGDGHGANAPRSPSSGAAHSTPRKLSHPFKEGRLAWSAEALQVGDLVNAVHPSAPNADIHLFVARVPAPVESELSAVAREAVTNRNKHAHNAVVAAEPSVPRMVPFYATHVMLLFKFFNPADLTLRLLAPVFVRRADTLHVALAALMRDGLLAAADAATGYTLLEEVRSDRCQEVPATEKTVDKLQLHHGDVIIVTPAVDDRDADEQAAAQRTHAGEGVPKRSRVVASNTVHAEGEKSPLALLFETLRSSAGHVIVSGTSLHAFFYPSKMAFDGITRLSNAFTLTAQGRDSPQGVASCLQAGESVFVEVNLCDRKERIDKLLMFKVLTLCASKLVERGFLTCSNAADGIAGLKSGLSRCSGVDVWSVASAASLGCPCGKGHDVVGERVNYQRLADRTAALSEVLKTTAAFRASSNSSPLSPLTVLFHTPASTLLEWESALCLAEDPRDVAVLVKVPLHSAFSTESQADRDARYFEYLFAATNAATSLPLATSRRLFFSQSTFAALTDTNERDASAGRTVSIRVCWRGWCGAESRFITIRDFHTSNRVSALFGVVAQQLDLLTATSTSSYQTETEQCLTGIPVGRAAPFSFISFVEELALMDEKHIHVIPFRSINYSTCTLADVLDRFPSWRSVPGGSPSASGQTASELNLAAVILPNAYFDVAERFMHTEALRCTPHHVDDVLLPRYFVTFVVSPYSLEFYGPPMLVPCGGSTLRELAHWIRLIYSKASWATSQFIRIALEIAGAAEEQSSVYVSFNAPQTRTIAEDPLRQQQQQPHNQGSSTTSNGVFWVLDLRLNGKGHESDTEDERMFEKLLSEGVVQQERISSNMGGGGGNNKANGSTNGDGRGYAPPHLLLPARMIIVDKGIMTNVTPAGNTNANGNATSTPPSFAISNGDG